jgi:isopentenyl phosphate kinase
MLKAFFAMETFTWAKKKKIVIHGGGAFFASPG